MLSGLPRTSVGFHFNLSFPMIMLKGVGWEINSSYSYNWNGRQRPEEQCVFQYSVNGQGELEHNGNTYKVKQGEAFMVEIPGDHCYRLPPCSDHWEVLYLEFDKNALLLWRQLLAMSGPVLSIPENSAVHSLMWDLYRKAVRNDIHHVYEGAKLAYTFIMELMCLAHEHQANRTSTSKTDLCKRFIETHYAEPIGLNEMAAAAQLSKYHLSREFEKKFGVSPIQYLTEIRLEIASKLLHASSDNLDCVAKRVGFSSSNYFLKVFTKHFGLTPTQFRKKNNSYEVSRVLLT